MLSPLLFNILFDFVFWKMDTIECGIEWTSSKRLGDLNSADDTWLLASDVDELQKMVDYPWIPLSRKAARLNSQLLRHRPS